MQEKLSSLGASRLATLLAIGALATAGEAAARGPARSTTGEASCGIATMPSAARSGPRATAWTPDAGTTLARAR